MKTQLSALSRHMLGNLLGLHTGTLCLIETNRTESQPMLSQTLAGTKGLRIILIVRKAMAIILVIVMDIVMGIATHIQTVGHITPMNLHTMVLHQLVTLFTHQRVQKTSLIHIFSILMSQ